MNLILSLFPQYCGIELYLNLSTILWMAKRTVQQIRKKILEVLKDNKEYSFGALERKVDTNWQTIRNHCNDLMLFKAVSISQDNKVRITKEGREVLKNLK